MPKVSKVRAKGNGYTNTPAPKRTSSVFKCTRCGREYSKQKGIYHSSFSPLFRENNGYVPICNVCIDELFDHYRGRMPSEEDAMRRLCMICDLYWTPTLYESIKRNGSASISLIRAYISKLNLSKYNGKTFDDTIDEERLAAADIVVADKPKPQPAEEPPVEKKEKKQTVTLPTEAPKPSADTILFWGSGLTPEIYQDLNLRFQRWTREVPKPMSDAVEGLYKQLCIAEVNVNQNMGMGKSAEASQKIIADILVKLGISPDQQVEEDNSMDADDTPMGVWVRRWEDKRPLPEPEEDDDMKDSAGLIRYITTWFLGHAGKMLGIKNIYTKMYEDEIAKYRIERPEYADEEDDDFLADLFGEDGDSK